LVGPTNKKIVLQRRTAYAGASRAKT